MDKQNVVARNALVFLERVDLKGAELIPFTEVVEFLKTFLEPVSGTQEKSEGQVSAG